MARKKTHEEYVAELAIKHPNIEVIEEYINDNTKIQHMCKIDGFIWRVIPRSLLQGAGCPKCHDSKKTHKQYVEEVAKVNPNIEVLGIYVNSKTSILHKCKVHGKEWMAIPSHILRGSGCSECGKEKISNRFKKTHEQYVEELAKVNSNIEVVGIYAGSMTKILHRCKIDGHEWYVIPNSILQGYGCPECNKRKLAKIQTKTHDQYIQEVAKINFNIEVIGIYEGDGIPILHKCKIDGYEWYAKPNNVLQGTGCPKCNMSRGERFITNWLNKNNILYEQQKIFDECRNKLPLPFDFYLTDYNIAIEYNGKQHYEPIDYFGGKEAFENIVIRDKIKEDYCNKNNIRLIKIAYNENISQELQKLYELFIFNKSA